MGLTAEEVHWYVPHQANKRILDGTAKKLGIPREKVVITLPQHANTSAASIPLALNTALEDGRIKEGQLVLMEANGRWFYLGLGPCALVAGARPGDRTRDATSPLCTTHIGSSEPEFC